MAFEYVYWLLCHIHYSRPEKISRRYNEVPTRVTSLPIFSLPSTRLRDMWKNALSSEYRGKHISNSNYKRSVLRRICFSSQRTTRFRCCEFIRSQRYERYISALTIKKSATGLYSMPDQGFKNSERDSLLQEQLIGEKCYRSSEWSLPAWNARSCCSCSTTSAGRHNILLPRCADPCS